MWRSRRDNLRRFRPAVTPLEDRTAPAGLDLATALPIAATGVRADRLDAPGAAGLFRVTVAESGRLTALVHGNGLDTRLSLLGPDGRLLVQSDGQSAADRDDLI